jgi:AcrR family transcriptional regulator
MVWNWKERFTLARFTRTDWLDLASRLLAEEGPSGLVIERLTEAAGRTRGSFYHHFESRDAFLSALMEHWRDRVMEQAAQVYRDDPSPAAMKALLRHAPDTLNHAFEREVRRLAASEPVVRAGVKRVDDERISGAAFLIGLVRPEVDDPETMAIIQYAVLVGLQWLLDVDDDPRLPAIKRVAEPLFGLADD